MTLGIRPLLYVVAAALAVVPVSACGDDSSSRTSAASFCTALDEYWHGSTGVNAKFISLGLEDPPELRAAATDAQTLADKAPTADLRSDFTKIADVLTAAANGNTQQGFAGTDATSDVITWETLNCT